MSAELQFDLRDVNAWEYNRLWDGREDPDVIVSRCGRYTVVRYGPQHFRPWRRYPKAERRMATPIGEAEDIAAAVEICATHAEQEGST